MSEADGGFEGVAVVGSIVVGSTPPEDIMKSTPLYFYLMFWLGVGGATGVFGGGQKTAMISGGTLSGTSTSVSTQLWTPKPYPR